jgi:hypothetical protein
MPSITTWTRLEPRARGADLLPALEARIHDPAWLLGRQWQLAEFRGQDAAFPIQMSYDVTSQPLTGYQPGGTADPFPIEASAAPEPAGPMTAGLAATAGTELLELLSEHGCSVSGRQAILTAFPLTLDPAAPVDAQGASYLGLLAGRVPDGRTLQPVFEQAVNAGAGLPATLGLSAADTTAVMAAATVWLAWIDSLARTSPAAGYAWQNATLDHAFTISTLAAGATPAVELSAPDWPGGTLDWYDFDARAVTAGPPATGSTAGTTQTGTGAPHPLTYPGAPERRYWAFEDGNVNLADIQLAPNDLGRMLVFEFASMYGNDWYLQPLELPVGALHTVTRLTVTDSFGEAVELAAVGAGTAPDWCVFRPALQNADGSATTATGLLLPPAIVGLVCSPAIEAVTFVRDEVNDIGWAVEHTVTGADARPFDRFPAELTGVTPSAPSAADDSSALSYVLESDVPAYCFPLTPDVGGAAKFDLTVLKRVSRDGTADDVPPLGAVLGQITSAGIPIWQAAVPAEGLSVERHWCMTRGFDGSVLLWIGRNRKLGATAPSVVLSFDQSVSRT